jgi:hypothetical protein
MAFAWTAELSPGTVSRVSATDADLALRYLADGGFTLIGPDRWRWDGTPPEEMSGEDVAFDTAFEITVDEGLDAVQRVHTAFGLLDLTGAFVVLIHLNAYVCDNADSAVADAFWDGVRARMAVPEPLEHLRLDLRTYWFWGHPSTVKAAFDALLGDDVRRLATAGRLAELATGPLHLRARHVLEDSGSVHWADKRHVYQVAATVAELVRRSSTPCSAAITPSPAISTQQRPSPCWTACVCPWAPNTCLSCARSCATGVANHYNDPSAWPP